MMPPKIDSYRFGRIVIDGQPYSKDVILVPDGVVPGWWRKEGHSLHPADLDAIQENPPRILVIGLGAFSRMHIPEATKQWLDESGIELVALPSKDACNYYNQIREQGDVAAAIHLTC
jgi:hypothetical protein